METWRMLLAKLVSGDWRERSEAVQSLAQENDLALAQAVLVLVQEQHHDLNALSAALQVLQQVGRPITGDLINMLDEAQGDMRIYIPLLLGSLSDPQAIPALMAVVKDKGENENSRFNAIEALGKLRAVEAVDLLLEVLEGQSQYLCYAAVVALGEIGSSEASDKLVDLLRDPYLAEPAVTALGMIGSVQALPNLIGWMKNSTNQDVFTVVTALAAIGRRDEKQVRELLQRHFDDQARQQLYETIRLNYAGLEEAHLGYKESDKAEVDPWWGDAALVVSWLITEDMPAEAVELDVLAELLTYPAAVPVAEASLRKAGPASAGALRRSLASMIASELHYTRPEVVYIVERLLIGLNDLESMPLFIRLLEEGDEMLAALAATGLGKNSEDQAIDRLIDGLYHSSAQVRRAVIDALAKQPDQDAIAERAKGLFAVGDASVREAAVCLLAAKQAERHADWLFSALSDPEIRVRQAVIDALPKTKDARTPDVLRRVLADPNEPIRHSAARACAHLPAEMAIPLLQAAAQDESMWVRRIVAEGMGQLAAPGCLAVLAQLIADPEVPVRAAAVQSMAECAKLLAGKGSPEAAEVEALLKQKVSDEQEDIEVRMAARTALMQIMAGNAFILRSDRNGED